METTMRAILLYDAQGTKYDGAMKSAVKKFIPGVTPYSTLNVLKGELLVEYRQDGQPLNYRLHRDPNVLLFCEVDNVAPLGPSEFLLLEAVAKPGDRMEAFRHKLEWGVTLKEGSKVYVTLPGENLSDPVRARAVVHYKGKVINQTGTLFGVELLGQSHREAKLGTSDGTFQGRRYFHCEDQCGVFTTVRWLSKVDELTSTAVECTDKTRREEPKPTYSNVASRDISGPPSQHTRSKDRPPLNKSASTDSSPSLPPRSQGNKPPYSKLASTDDVLSRQGKPPTESSVDPSIPPPQFHINQPVMFYNKYNKKFYGVVRWTGRESATKKFDYNVVGILTDEDIFKSDFADSIYGLDQNLKGSPKRRILFLPEVLVEAVPGALPASDPPSQPEKSVSTQAIAETLEVSPEQLVKEQKEALEQVEKDKIAKEEEDARNAAKVVGESITGQAEHYRKLQAQSAHFKGNQGQQNVTEQQEELWRYQEEKRAQAINNSGSGRGGQVGNNQTYPQHPHEYENPDNLTDPSGMINSRRQPKPSPSSVHRPVNQQGHPSDNRYLSSQDHVPRYPQESGAAGDPAYFQNTGGSYHDYDPSSYQNRGADHQNNTPLYPGQEAKPELSQGHGNNQAPLPHEGSGHPQAPGYRNDHFDSRQREDRSQPLKTGAQHEDLHNQPEQKIHGDGYTEPRKAVPQPGHEIFASTGEANASHSLGVGSLIQLPTTDGGIKYGTIKWIGLVSNVQGQIAGIEMDEFMDGCGDGKFEATGQKFFSCPYGRALYYPLNKLRPDQRYATEVATDGNPLRDVSAEELVDTSVAPRVDMYIGMEKGIQGHQNSCYLDATLFGLFALTSEFDDLFLRTQSDQSPIGTILWKNIVNPLRKNAIVKYECVMRLREQLDQLGKMKGITQDEKDPEEFLNLMFKHTLHVEPFISIRRPYGVEKEYFVQLFLEMDGSQKSPSIGDLLEKMFTEQNISFTEIPKKLLIQVPRFGKKFQTFQKVIPAKTINVGAIVDVTTNCFFCGTSNARKYCLLCETEFGKEKNYCDRCLEIAHGHSIRANHHDHVMLCKEAAEVKSMADLELLSVICIETSHYVCFTRQENRWIFFDSMAERVYDKYNLPKVADCTGLLNDWVYPYDGDLSRLLNTPPRELPEYVRRFTQDIYMCVYIQPDMAMYS